MEDPPTELLFKLMDIIKACSVEFFVGGGSFSLASLELSKKGSWNGVPNSVSASGTEKIRRHADDGFALITHQIGYLRTTNL